MRRIVLGLAMAPGLIGLALIAAGFYHGHLASQSKSWLAVEGEVVSAESLLVVHRLSSFFSEDHFLPVTRYRYVVDGQAFESTRARLADSVPSFDTREQAAAHAANRFPVGKKVEVFYDPGDPASSVLNRRRPDESIFTFFAFGAVLCGFGLATFFVASKLVPKTQGAPRRLACRRCQCEYLAAEKNKDGLCPACVAEQVAG